MISTKTNISSKGKLPVPPPRSQEAVKRFSTVPANDQAKQEWISTPSATAEEARKFAGAGPDWPVREYAARDGKTIWQVLARPQTKTPGKLSVLAAQIKDPEKRAAVEAIEAKKAAARKTKREVKREIHKAKESGDTVKMPLVGKAARDAIKAEAAKATAKQNATKRAGHGRKTELRPDGLRVGSGMAKLVDAVCRDSGATNDQLKEAVGWSQCLPMMKKACDKAGVKLRTEKLDGQPVRYFGTPAKRKAA